MEWMIMPLRRYADFQGRSRRMEFWMWVLFTIIVGIVLGIIDGILGLQMARSTSGPYGAASGGAAIAAMSSMGILGIVWSLGTLIPNIAVGVRRLHDTDRTGWWILAPVLPYLIGIVIMLSALMGQSFGLVAVGGIFMLLALPLGIVLLVFYCLPGTPGSNRFGPDPMGSQADLSQTFQ